MVKKQRPFFITVLLAVFLSGCLYYDYGVDKQENKLPYRTYYHNEKDLKYDFETVLYAAAQEPKGPNYAGFTIRIAHLRKENKRSSDKGKYVSTIWFSDFSADDDIQLIPESIILVHKDNAGEVIQPESVRYDFSQPPEKKYRSHFYQAIYDPKKLTEEVKESVSLEIVIDGQKKKIKYEFPIEKVLHYTLWDMMMGV